MTVKSNQPNLLTELISRFKPILASAPDHVIEERGHGRKKRWSLWVLPATDLDFPHLEQIACIRRDTWTLDIGQINTPTSRKPATHSPAPTIKASPHPRE